MSTLGVSVLALFALLQLSVSAYALWKGGAPERTVSIAMLVASVLSVLFAHRAREAFETIQWEVFWIDCALLASLVLVALFAERFWPLCVAALQLVAVMLHLLRIVDPTMLRLAYLAVQTWWAYPMMACLVTGTIRHQQRIARYGSDASWSISFAR